MSNEGTVFSPHDIADRITSISTGLHAEYLTAQNIVRISDAYEGTFIEATQEGHEGEWNLNVWNVAPAFYPSTGDPTTDLGFAIKSNGHPDGAAFYFASLVYQADHPTPTRTCRVPSIKNDSYRFVRSLGIDDVIDSILDQAAGRQWDNNDEWWILRAMKRGRVRDHHLPKKP